MTSLYCYDKANYYMIRNTYNTAVLCCIKRGSGQKDYFPLYQNNTAIEKHIHVNNDGGR